MNTSRLDQSRTPDEVVTFWRSAGMARWFAKDATFDAHFRETFLVEHFAAAARERDHWADEAQGALALLILLDQFPRNAFRRTAHMYATTCSNPIYACSSICRSPTRKLSTIRIFR